MANIETESFLPQKPERMSVIEDAKRKELVHATYDIVGCLHEVYKQLGAGLPEYIYQEALAKQLERMGIAFHKEEQYHPLFNGEPLEAFLKMDFVVESSIGKVIIECKALTSLGEKEHYQTFGYMRATKYPVAILVNFGTDHRAQIERYCYLNNRIYVF